MQAWLKWITICVVLMTALGLLGCGPDHPKLGTTIQQVGEAAAYSLLTQADWKAIAARVSAEMGPGFKFNAFAYQETRWGVGFESEGGKLAWDISGQGTGGGYNPELAKQINNIITHWEQQSDLSEASRLKLQEMIAQAVVDYYQAPKTTSTDGTTP